MYFTEGHTDLLLEPIGTEGSNCFSRGIRTCTSISKVTDSNLRFSKGGVGVRPLFLPSRSAHAQMGKYDQESDICRFYLNYSFNDNRASLLDFGTYQI